MSNLEKMITFERLGNIKERLAKSKLERTENIKSIMKKYNPHFDDGKMELLINRLKEKSLINKETKMFKFEGQTFNVPQGKFAYDVIVENGYKGTRQEFIKELFNIERLKERIKK